MHCSMGISKQLNSEFSFGCDWSRDFHREVDYKGLTS